jgi:hypothetical protein
MPNAIYPKWKEAVYIGAPNTALNGSGTTGVYEVLVDNYVYNPAHQFYSDLTGIVPVAEQECLNKTYTNGVFDHDNPTWPSVPGAGAPTYEAIVYFIKNAGANTTWRLFAIKDTGITNLPVTANGQNITHQVNASGSIAL